MTRLSYAAIAAASLCLIASAAPGQTTTRCYNLNGQTICRSEPAGGIDWSLAQPQTGNPVMEGFLRGQQQRAQMEQDRALAEQAEQARSDVQAAEERRRQAGALVAAGNCDAARKMALTSGDFGLAQAVKQACQ